MKPDFNEDRNIAEGIAKAASPYETGNLRYNAIKSELVQNGFNIIYDLNSAFYIYFLEEGTKYTQKHKGFIEYGTVPLIAGFLRAKYNDDREQLHRYKMIARDGYKDLVMIKGIERKYQVDLFNVNGQMITSNRYDYMSPTQDLSENSMIGRGHRLAHSISQNAEVLDIQYHWKYRNE